MLPRRRKPQRSGIARVPRKHFPSHLAWLRGFVCCVHERGDCEGRIEAAHVRLGAHAGMGQKPDDRRAVPLCAHHHAEQHRIGEASFAAKYKIDLEAVADRLARVSPHRWRWEDQG